MVTLFGTDGVRGLVNSTLMPELAYQLGRAAGAYFCKASGKHRFLIGMDTRISGSMLTAALSAGLCASGVDVDLAGVIPTPGIAYLTRTEGYDAGVMISASHNPFPDNGIKFFDKNGYKLPDETEEDIENILRHDEEIPRPTGDKIGVISHRPELADKYRAHVLSTVQGDFKGLKIVTDSANGAASDFLPAMLEELGAEVTAIFHEPNGVNINNGCGSTHIETLQKKVLELGADCGIANDGDADRCLFVDEKGQVMDGDHLMLINALQMKKEGRLHENMVVGTVMSNLGFGKALKENGCQTVSTQVGDRYVLEEMLKHDYSIGGEQSGHIIFPEFNTTGDGLITAVQTLKVLLNPERPCLNSITLWSRIHRSSKMSRSTARMAGKTMNSSVTPSVLLKKNSAAMAASSSVHPARSRSSVSWGRARRSISLNGSLMTLPPS